MSSVPFERFVPQGHASLVEDAPGWGETPPTPFIMDNITAVGSASFDASAGPNCWKCRGTGTKQQHKPVEMLVQCPVCSGRGRMPPKKAQVDAATLAGRITRGRRCPAGFPGWVPTGPLPHALTAASTASSSSLSQWATMVRTANTDRVDVDMPNDDDDDDGGSDTARVRPSWIPTNGEELCNLVGSWRILQRVGSHRWTTDDLVTAFTAATELSRLSTLSINDTTAPLQYLDLGTGNASVLQMVTWTALKAGRSVQAMGVEARSEAVQLARRSISFNLGGSDGISNNKSNNITKVVHGDFRDVALEQEFDLVTGTPPYFRVDFTVQNGTVASAVIQQGGMPTAIQSAPARCEFRGGIEAYCEAAARVLKLTGRFVVCENWANHDRVLVAADQYQLHVVREVQVQGREERGTLFCVYVMKAKSSDDVATSRETLAVRDGQGNWTERYQRTVLDTMSIPCA